MKNTSNLLKNYADKFEIFCDELLVWSKTHNITGYKTKADIMQNIADSIAPLEFIGDFQIALDIGSGCGFPAIPLAISLPQCEFILVEPQIKRASFLNIIAINLNLKNIRILKSRIEEISTLPKIDLITSRAFAKRSTIIALSARFLDENGHFLLYTKNAESIAKSAENTNIAASSAKIFYKSKSEVIKWENY
ncbi:16S rRNA (guanine(527)-N(7))-methyltransferase RsmG [Helicobacter sp. 23-1044]